MRNFPEIPQSESPFPCRYHIIKAASFSARRHVSFSFKQILLLPVPPLSHKRSYYQSLLRWSQLAKFIFSRLTITSRFLFHPFLAPLLLPFHSGFAFGHFKFHCVCHIPLPRFSIIFNTNDFFIHFFRKYTFGRFPIDIAEKCSHIRIESIAFPLAFQENFRRQISQLQSFFLDISMPDGRRCYLRAGLRYQTAVSQVTCS